MCLFLLYYLLQQHLPNKHPASKQQAFLLQQFCCGRWQGGQGL